MPEAQTCARQRLDYILGKGGGIDTGDYDLVANASFPDIHGDRDMLLARAKVGRRRPPVRRLRQEYVLEQATCLPDDAVADDVPTKRVQMWKQARRGEGMMDSRKMVEGDSDTGNPAEYNQCKAVVEMQDLIQRLGRESL